MKKRTKGRILSLLLTVCMLLGTLPAELFGGVTAVKAGNSITHDFTANGKDSDFFTISGNLASNKGTVVYDGKTLTQCLKMESATNITFTPTSDGVLTLVFAEANNTKAINVDGSAKSSNANGIVTVDVSAGQVCTLTKGNTTNLFYMVLTYENTTPHGITVSDGAGVADGAASTVTDENGDPITEASAGATVTVTAAEAAEGMQFTEWSGTYIEDGATKNIEFANSKDKTTTFTMPAAEVTLSTSYASESSLHSVTVVCDGGEPVVSQAAEGKEVTITADKISGKRFAGWEVTSGSLTLTDEQKAAEKLTFTMPAYDVALVASYVAETGRIHNFTEDGTSSDFFTITGNLATNKGTVSYNGLTLTQCLKLESATNIAFTPASDGTLTLVFGASETANIKVNGAKETGTGNVMTVSVKGGTTYTLTKGDTANIFYMSLTYGDSGSTDPAVTEYNITATDCTVTDADGNSLTKAAADTVVTVQANAAPAGQEFDKWEVTPATLSLTNDAAEAGKATFTMPAGAVTIKAVYKAKTYTLTVTNGTAKATNEAGKEITSPLPAGATVVLTPNEAPANQIFDKWVVNSGELTLTAEQAKTAGLTFTMPESAVEIEATYKSDANAHTITVTGGTANPAKAEQGATITIKAGAAPAGQEFDKWVVKAGTFTLANEKATETTFTMPAENVEVEATYKKLTVVEPDSASSDVKDVQMDEANKPVFKNALNNEVSGKIIIHAEKQADTSALTDAIKTKINALIADLSAEDKENVQTLCYDINAYLDTAVLANKVSMTGKVKIKFAYPEEVTSRNTIYALHEDKEVEVKKESNCFWVTADGFSPYTILIMPVAESSVTITREGGYEEGAYAEWSEVAGADGYLAYVSTSPTNFPESSRIDNELLRKYADHWRVDTVGLKAGTYYIKVVAATVDATTKEATPIGEAVTGALTVEGYDRTGFAFSKGSGSKYSGTGLGAYNNDGTLKSGAQVIYVTADTAKTCKATVNGAEVVGLQSILDAKQKGGTENDILDIRIIGKISRTDLDHISSSAEGLQIKGKAKYNDMNITIEGIGEDATVHGFGFLVRNCANVEFRNFAVMAFMDDGISLDTANCNIWIHDMDLFYGSTGGDSDQAKGDGSIDVKGKSTYITISYNHFWDSGKCSLCGMSDSEEFMVTYHHNWFDHSDSRHARVRVGSIHFYNNYYDGNAKYGVGVTKASSAFVEANYFRNCKSPMLISKQGSDIAEGLANATFSGEPGGMIKAYNNVVVGAKRLIYANAGQGVQGATGPADNKEFDAYLASARDEEVDEFDVTASGGTPYNNFDLTYDLGVRADQIDAPGDVPAIVTVKAGRLNGGDFKWDFDNTTEDTNYGLIKELKSAVVNYTSSVETVGGIDGVVSGSNSGGGGNLGGEDPDEGGDDGDGDDPILSTGTVHNFTTDGNASSYYKITGNMKSNPDAMSYGGMTLTKALKMEGSTEITFTAASAGTLILVQAANKKTKIDGTNYTSDASGVLKVENLPAGAHEITKGDSTNLYYIAFLPDGGGEDPNPPVEGSYKITVTNGTASAASAKAGEKITISAKTIAGKTFEKWVVKSGAVELTNETSSTTTFTMPAAAVTIEAQYKDAETPVDPVDPENKDFELNVGRDLSNGTYTANVQKNGFTILADATNSVAVDDNKKTVDKVDYTKRLKTSGAGTEAYRSISFTAEENATLTMIAVSSNSTDTRTVGIGTLENGKLNDGQTISVGTAVKSYTVKLKEAGTYYIHSTSGGVNFYYLKVSYPSQTEDPGSTRVDDEVREQAPDFKAGDLYVSTKGTSSAAGSFEDPMDLKTALNSITPGHTIWMFSGTYYAYDMYEEPIIITESNSGTADALKKISSINGKRVTIDFDGMEELGSNRGITLDGSYWHFYDIDICNAGDNGMLLSGDHNTIELCQFYGNHDTGLQLSRFNTTYASKEQWPSYNLILNCTAFNNKDEATAENADGFAAKLTCGEGNVFDGCIAYCNSDDGWDLFAKTATGPIGQVTLRNCISFANGKLTNGEGSANGDMNGFKLGGSGVATAHIVENCLAFNNGATGFTDNNNPGAHQITNCTAVNNGKYDSTKANLMIYRASSDARYTNLLSSVDSTKASTDQFKGTLSNSLYHYKDGKENGSYYWVNSYNFGGDKLKYTGSEKADYTVTDADFVNVTIPGYNKATDAYTADYHEIFRNPDGSVNVDGLFEVKKESPLYTAGKDGTYIGAKFSKDGEPKTYTVSVESGSASPVKAIEGATVTITADTVPGMVFDKWTVKTGNVTLADATASETTFTMPAALVEIVANYKKAEVPVYNISITGGSATPTQASVGTKVTITAAAAPEGKVFEKWVVKAGGITLADETSATTTFTMGSAIVELEAVYKDAQTTPVDPVDPTPTDPTPTDPVTPENPVTPGDSDDDDDDDDYEAPAAPETPAAPSAPAAPTAPGKRVVRGDQTVVTDAQVVGNATFTRSNGNEATGDIIIHAETATPTEDILKTVAEYTKAVKDASKVIVQYYDIKAYEGVIDSAHVVTLNGKVKIKFQYPAGVTKDNYDIIALHGTNPVPVEMQKSFFWITADGFSPYTIVYVPKEAQSAKTGDTATVQPDNAQAANQDPVVGGAAAVVTTPQNSGSSVFVIVLIAMIVGVAAIGFVILASRRKKDE